MDSIPWVLLGSVHFVARHRLRAVSLLLENLPTLEFGHGADSRVQGLDLVLVQ